MKLRMMASALALSAALIGGVTLAPSATQAATLSGGFDVGPGGFQGNFNPLAATAGFTWLSVYFEPLVTYDEKLQKVVGVLADSYEVSPDQMTYTFKLADAKWHDGKPFTVQGREVHHGSGHGREIGIGACCQIESSLISRSSG